MEGRLISNCKGNSVISRQLCRTGQGTWKKKTRPFLRSLLLRGGITENHRKKLQIVDPHTRWTRWEGKEHNIQGEKMPSAFLTNSCFWCNYNQDLIWKREVQHCIGASGKREASASRHLFAGRMRGRWRELVLGQEATRHNELTHEVIKP